MTGDTKVVEKNKCDGIYINTTGIGEIVRPMRAENVSAGDSIIVTGTLGDHGTAVALARDEFNIEATVESDCASLNDLLIPAFEIEGLKDIEIRITDVTGKLVYTKEVGKASGAYRENIDISNYAKGMYLLQIKTDDVVVSRRVTIQ